MNTNRMSCGEARERLPLYVGGDLDTDALEAVRGHLDLCSECARQAGEAARARRELVAAFRAREADFAQPELWSGIRAALRAEGLVRDPADKVAPSSAPALSRRARRTWTWRLAPLAAAAVVLLALQLGGGFSGNGPKRLPAPVAPRANPEVVLAPVTAPATGTLQPIAPDAARLPMPYQPRHLVAPSGDASLTGFSGGRLNERIK